MEKIETILTNCIEDIKSGRASLAECLDRYPSRRQELEPLLKVALNIHEPGPLQLDSSYKATAKAQLLRQIRAAKPKESRSSGSLHGFRLFPQPVWARVAVSAFLVVILLSMATAGTAYASQSSLPGDLLYPVKTSTEDVRLFFASDSSAKADLNIQFAHTRLVEMSKLADKNERKTELAVDGYRGNLNAALGQIRRISEASHLSGRLESALEDMQNQVVFCDEVIDAYPAYVGPVGEASTLAINEQLEFLGMLAQQDILRAAQINLDSMQNRLQRAQVAADGNHYETMQQALLQYQQFNGVGDQILQSAQTADDHSTEIEDMSLQALTGYLDILDTLSEQVPLEYQDSVQAFRQETLQFQTQARYGHQNQGGSGQGASMQPLGSTGSSTSGLASLASQYQKGDANTGEQTPSTGIHPLSAGEGSAGSVDGTNYGTSAALGEAGSGGSTSTSGASFHKGEQKP